MSLSAPPAQKVDARAFRIGLAVARFNKRLVDALLQQVRAHLWTAGVKQKKLVVVRVPGSNELPSAAQLLARQAKFDALIALGVLIRGDTSHHEIVAQAAAHALQRVALDEHTPIINGIIVTETRAQAEARCLGKIDRGAEFARAALEMAALKRRLSR